MDSESNTPCATRARIRTAIWLIADQGLFSATSMALGLILAKTMGIAELGKYALLQAGVTFTVTLHSAFIAEPMVVFGAALDGAPQRNYARRVLTLQWVITSCAAACLVMATPLLAGRAEVAPTSAMLVALGTPLYLLIHFQRRLALVEGLPIKATLITAIYGSTVVAAACYAGATGHLTATNACLIAALAGCAALVPLRDIINKSLTSIEGLRHTAKIHFDYGAWALVSTISAWVPQNVPILFIAAHAGNRAAGELRLLMYLLAPGLQTAYVSGTWLVRFLRRQQHAPPNRSRQLTMLLLTAVGCGIAYGSAVIVIAFLVSLSQGSEYGNLLRLSWSAAWLPLITAVTVVSSSALRALERPDKVARAYFTSAAAALSFTAVSSAWAAPHLVILSATLGQLIGAIYVTSSAWRTVRDTHPSVVGTNMALALPRGVAR